ncbi:p21-activated protein kinase-interacting protein 1-like [Monomorium pharaonis]|uniref:p21-activated protein kinase-interacting protein 1-like n=1 Tax=Monomorium pharaonis TaxID=307658 RepID=UPI00063F1A12|nr:p21-activated protein kinase-interacting protein 1-like [Monomorium pharaonis]
MDSDAGLSNPFEIVVGTYEQYLLGYKVHNIVNEYKIEKSFATHNHVASIRSVTSSKHHLASAGADETVCLYDMRYRRESGKLIHHKDTINCIAFTPEGSHLFSCSNDGSITAVRCGSWQLEKVWPTAHKGSAVNTLAIHPTGKLALSTGQDGILRTWNLIKGRPAYATNLVPKLKSNAKWITVIKWSPSGERYLLAAQGNIYVYLVESAGIEKELTFDSNVICVEFLKDDFIAVGFENGDIRFCDLKTSMHTINTKAHSMRVKCLAHMNDLLVSASSSGEIKLWRYNKHSLDMLQTVNCGARITCLSLTQTYKDLVQQKEIESEEEEEKEDEKIKNRLRLKHEVIIENEEDLEVTGVRNRKEKMREKKHGKKREIVEDAEDVQPSKKKAAKVKETIVSKKKRDRSSQMEDVIEKSKKKKKLLKANETSPNKKRKDRSAALQITLPAKIKKIKTNKIEEYPSRKHKIIPVTDAEDAPPRKIKKKANTEKRLVPKKKKKKITR